MYNHPSLRDQHNTEKNNGSCRYQHNWIDTDHLLRQTIPATVRPWLLDHGSLTKRLIKMSRGHFQVNVLRQEWSSLNIDEAQFLQCKPRERALVREVLLLGFNEAWVYARSVLPFSTLQGPLRHLRHFGAQSLGQYIFNHIGTQRDQFQVTLKPLMTKTLMQIESECQWGRRSRFFVSGRPLLVSEFFLPQFIVNVDREPKP